MRSLGSAIGHAPAMTFSLMAVGMDFFIVQAAALGANSVLQHGSDMSLIGILGANAVGLACCIGFQHEGLYEIGAIRNEARTIHAVLVRWSVLCLLLALSAVLFHHTGDRARLWMLLFYGAGLAAFCLSRLILARLVRDWLVQGNYVHAVGIIGQGELALQLTDMLAKNSSELKLTGVFGDHQPAGAARMGGIAELLNLAGRDMIDTVIIAEPDMPVERLRDLLQQLKQQPLRIYLMPGPIALEPLGRAWRGSQVFPGLNLLELSEYPISRMSLLVKSVVDRLAALFLLALMAPVLLACAVGIRFSGPGPVLFRQKRIGYKGREFMIFKFRTMHVSERPNIKLTIRNDPRVFRFGRFLRKTSLDELPQLFNVLRGEMSLVGPRPHMPQATAAGHLYFDAVSGYAARHRVKPGITGWAQVNGWRGATETVDQIKGRVAHDLYYIENWSLFLDFLIIFKTCFVFCGKDVF